MNRLVLFYILDLLWEGLLNWVLMRTLLFSKLRWYLMGKIALEVRVFEGLVGWLIKLPDLLRERTRIRTRLE
jgi:hypothetical protein